jgi:adenine-specific DNA-methyltransferase
MSRNGATAHADRSLPLLDQLDLWRLEASDQLDSKRRSEFGQFLTPSGIASFMASLFDGFHGEVRLLDAGAGAGTLLVATTLDALHRPELPTDISVTGYEIDPTLASYARRSTEALARSCLEVGIPFKAEVIETDFIKAAVEVLDRDLFQQGSRPSFTHAILNPPYRKLNSDSSTRLHLRRVGIETSNLYTAFVALAIQSLAPGGEIVAITPRSFCNGPYFHPFREFILGTTAIRKIHLFESRTAAFRDDDILQENVIFHLVKAGRQGIVSLSSSSSPDDKLLSTRKVPFVHIVRPTDKDLFIHLVPDQEGQLLSDAFAELPCELRELGLTVSTGKVVDFRAKEFLRASPTTDSRPLIYPTHFADGRVKWPKFGKKPNALVDSPSTAALWMPSGTYVLVKRFSSKEEPRRVVAAVFDPADAPGIKIGFENHLNVFHTAGSGCDPILAAGLSNYLNSTVVDTHFRQFNGHTQVNATDLRNLRYPSRQQLVELGNRVGSDLIDQDVLDEAVASVVGLVAHGKSA